jgi:hypothetical protein
LENEAEKDVLLRFVPSLKDNNMMIQLKKQKLSDLIDHSLTNVSLKDVEKMIGKLNELQTEEKEELEVLD